MALSLKAEQLAQAVHGWDAVPGSMAGSLGPRGAVRSGTGGAVIFTPFHCWPHQQRPSVSTMQVPLPQQRGSSDMANS
jgi:hypothetical protein